jgi:hypothetical protein
MVYIHSMNCLIYTYPMSLVGPLLDSEKLMNTAGTIRGLLCAQGTCSAGQGGSSWSNPRRLDDYQNDRVAEAGPCYQRPRVSKLLRRGYQAQVHWDSVVLVMARREAGCLPIGHSRAVFSSAKAKGDHQAQVHSDQMVLFIVRREAGPKDAQLRVGQQL